MRAMMDACILYPTVLREILIAAAGAGHFTPLWSPRILEEWARAAARTGDQAVARAEIALLTDGWPQANILHDPADEETLSLPDPGDLHVLAAAVAGQADTILTVNLRDFPGRTLARHGISPRAPDSLLVELHAEAPDSIAEIVDVVRIRTEEISGRDQPLRPLLKRAGLPRLGKALCA